MEFEAAQKRQSLTEMEPKRTYQLIVREAPAGTVCDSSVQPNDLAVEVEVEVEGAIAREKKVTKAANCIGAVALPDETTVTGRNAVVKGSVGTVTKSITVAVQGRTGCARKEEDTKP